MRFGTQIQRVVSDYRSVVYVLHITKTILYISKVFLLIMQFFDGKIRLLYFVIALFDEAVGSLSQFLFGLIFELKMGIIFIGVFMLGEGG